MPWGALNMARPILAAGLFVGASSLALAMAFSVSGCESGTCGEPPVPRRSKYRLAPLPDPERQVQQVDALDPAPSSGSRLRAQAIADTPTMYGSTTGTVVTRPTARNVIATLTQLEPRGPAHDQSFCPPYRRGFVQTSTLHLRSAEPRTRCDV